MSGIEDLVNFQAGKSLKLTPNISIDSITSVSHFSKMNVGTAQNIFSNSDIAGLQYLVVKEDRPAEYCTPAWHIRFVDQWFELMGSRDPVMAFSKKKTAACNRARKLLPDFIEITRTLQIGEKRMETSSIGHSAINYISGRSP